VVSEGECGAPHPVAHAEPLEAHRLVALGAHRELGDRRPAACPALDRALGEEIGERVPEKLVVQPVEECRRVHGERPRGLPHLVTPSRTSRQAMLSQADRLTAIAYPNAVGKWAS